MAKRRFYLILSIVTIISLFSFAAICTQCGAGTEDKVGTEDEEASEEVISQDEEEQEDEDNIEGEDGADETEAASEEDADSDADTSDDDADSEEAEDSDDAEAPTISLFIYEGPFPAGSLCVYRVQANVTGNPSPSITWSKDDSGGSWGTKKAQVNLNNPGDTYTLTATATNSAGSASTSIDLSWGCEEPEPEPDPEPIEEIVDIVADPSLSGWIRVDWTAHPGDIQLYVGDTPIDKQAKAYLSFYIDDISDLDDVTINSVSLSMPLDIKVGNPELVTGSQIHIKVYDYGNSLELADQAIGGELVVTLAALASLTEINFTSDKLHDELQKAIDADKEWFQLKIGPSGILANGIWDYYRFNSSSAVLHVKYETPG
ncbi:hypothetical protein ACFLQQ_01430 [Actinomycetota bacterium]